MLVFADIFKVVMKSFTNLMTVLMNILMLENLHHFVEFIIFTDDLGWESCVFDEESDVGCHKVHHLNDIGKGIDQKSVDLEEKDGFYHKDSFVGVYFCSYAEFSVYRLRDECYCHGVFVVYRFRDEFHRNHVYQFYSGFRSHCHGCNYVCQFYNGLQKIRTYVYQFYPGFRQFQFYTGFRHILYLSNDPVLPSDS